MRTPWIVVAVIILAAAVAFFIAERGYDRLKWSGDEGRLAVAQIGAVTGVVAHRDGR